MSEADEVVIYTRGVSSNAGTGGFAAILTCRGYRKEITGGRPSSSNNRMDILAAIEGLRSLKRPCRVTIYNNNTYLVDAISKGWAATWRARGWRDGGNKPTPHADLWKELLTLCSTHAVSFVYRKLDGRDRDLASCDALAHEAARLCDLTPHEQAPVRASGGGASEG